jgi:hydroxymethylglutaryl-CoA lyase
MLEIVECPRDAMQGIKEFIPTEKKLAYLQQLLKVGFDVIDCGSFVSHKAIPQMADTHEIIQKLSLDESPSKLLTIAANERGAKDAASYEKITYIGYPFSISETFQLRNTNSTIAQSLERVKKIQEICVNADKQLVIYISMGFGNPYGDPWNAEIVFEWVERLKDLGIKIFALSDTIGVANSTSIYYLFSKLIPQYEELVFGAHLHTRPDNWHKKIIAAYEAGCRRFDGAIKGFGGCPMAKDELVGNMPTENLADFFAKKNEIPKFNHVEFKKAMELSSSVFLH